ncbi:MAG: UDP-2,3-diacylglucosamine diphosphatase [Gammaproteobacteria bacterium]|nr:UDP-2,3-diacylglucosamine diphosphatase [Gammaproteobacteria bacterium]
MHTLFISDLHLDASRPDLLTLFHDFINQQAPHAEKLYILGDFVEYWLGDDDPNPEFLDCFKALKKLSQNGTRVFLMHGNRDFLLGKQMLANYGIELIDDPTLINLYGTPTVLMHGDTLCSDDVKYQAFRQQVRDAHWQTAFLAKPMTERTAMVNGLRAASHAATGEKSSEIMDVNQIEVEKVMRNYKVQQLIHGHTHRPKTHHFFLDQQPCTRIVLADWQDHCCYLKINDDTLS